MRRAGVDCSPHIGGRNETDAHSPGGPHFCHAAGGARRRPGDARARGGAARRGVQAPRFEVDPLWPKPLPNHWVLGQAIGVWVDEQDVVWIVHRGSATLADNEKALELKNGECCAGAPPVLEFDRRGQPGAALGRARARATTGPTGTTASSSITTATSGSAATARATRTS